MTRAEAFDKAWRLGIKGDFSLYDEIVHTDYESINQGVKINRDVSKAVPVSYTHLTLPTIYSV